MVEQSIGARLHLVRIETGWSVEECAYRLTVASNQLITPDAWQAWERAHDTDQVMAHFVNCLPAIGEIFGIDSDWLLNGNVTTRPSAKILDISKRKHAGKTADPNS
jgi:transcriptional regulator with XRE-family HTH domain